MKNSILLVVSILFLFYSCKNESSKEKPIEGKMVFSGKITNPFSDSLSVYNFSAKDDVPQVIYLNDAGSFIDTLVVTPGYFIISDGLKQTTAYFRPGANLNLTYDVNKFDESIVYKGDAASENNYLAEKSLMEKELSKYDYYAYYGSLEENDFLRLTDSLYTLRIDLLNSKKNLNPEFYYVESNAIKYAKLERYSQYEEVRAFVMKDFDFKVSDSFPNPFDSIDFNDEKMLQAYIYALYLRSYFRSVASKVPDNEYHTAYINEVVNKVKSAKIKDDILFAFAKRNLGKVDDLNSIYNVLTGIIVSGKYKTEIEKLYNEYKITEKGAVSPDFKYSDINGDTVSLSDFIGKVALIDVWATWCGPCKMEIPHLKKLEEYFHGKDVVFVSICAYDNELKWREMVEAKQLGGVQLYASKQNTEFLDLYQIKGIPRFILIDKKGRIISSQSKRPSDPALKLEIETYLN